MILQDIKETKHYGHMVGCSDNVKTVYPPTNIVCGGYNKNTFHLFTSIFFMGLKMSRPPSSSCLISVTENMRLLEW